MENEPANRNKIVGVLTFTSGRTTKKNPYINPLRHNNMDILGYAFASIAEDIHNSQDYLEICTLIWFMLIFFAILHECGTYLYIDKHIFFICIIK